MARLERQIKCVVWDLDNTLWDGVLLEDDVVRHRPEIVEAIAILDDRGILQSIASRNDRAAALSALARLGIADYFLYPQIHWGSKASSISTLVNALCFSEESMAFIDDQPFERAEVAASFPNMLVLDPRDVGPFLKDVATNPRTVTGTGRDRRKLYQAEIQRNQDEANYRGSSAAFLEALALTITLRRATEQDLDRVAELTTRTSQLNSTGRVYSPQELHKLVRCPRHSFVTAAVEDRYGSYGTVGLILVEHELAVCTIRLLVVSCRVMSRGIGGALISLCVNELRTRGIRVRADFRPTSRNRAMLVAFRFGGFREIGAAGDVVVFEHAGDIPIHPAYLKVVVDDEIAGGLFANP